MRRHLFHNGKGTLRAMRLAGALLLVSATPTSSAPPQSKAAAIIGMASPYREAVLGASLRGRIDQIVSPEGSMVRKGDLVFRLDDRVQQARLATSAAAADSTLAIDLAKAKWDKATRDLDRLSKLYGSKFSSTKEMSDAIAEEAIKRLEHELAKFEYNQAKRDYKREQALLEQHNIRAPFDGYIAQHLKQPGEAAEEGDGVVRIAQLNPLRVAFDCPLGKVDRYETGRQVTVTPVDARFEPRIGTVILVNRVADGASQTVKVKVAVANDDALWPADLKVEITPNDDGGQIAERQMKKVEKTRSKDP